ncbi:hypothetical protein KJ359_003636 [Pestalotiopsis sp. 9143b]|nr:hypothetical protein KJ359_003636 [Pestalotiopsis sp. 9143b]
MATETPKPSVSIRKYIKWGDAPPSEPTSTRVLTSPEKRFVDVRLLLPESSQDLPVRDLAAVDWAFAGTSSHDETVSPPHSVFTHWVDSRHADAAAVRDEGDNFPGADEGESLERGHMVNPVSGRDEPYEECWVDGIQVDERGARADSGFVLRYEDGDDKGLVVRVGDLIQGVLRRDGDVGLFRWVLGHGETRTIVAEVGQHESFPRDGLTNPKKSDKIDSKNGWTWGCVEDW